MPKKRRQKAKPKDYAAGYNSSDQGQLETEIDGSHEQKDTRGRGHDLEICKRLLKKKGTFDSNDLPHLINFMIDGKLSNKWFDIGIQLGVDAQRLQNIAQQCHNDSEVGLREMLIIRLKQELTWDMLAYALSTPAVGGQRLVLDNEDVKSKPQDEVIKRKQQDEWMRSRPSSVLSLSPVYVEKRAGPDQASLSSFQFPDRGGARNLPPSDTISQSGTSSLFSASAGLITMSSGTGPDLNGYEKLPMYMNNDKADYTYKVIVVGDSNVGKTSLIARFVTVDGYKKREATVVALYHQRLIRAPSGYTVKLEIWDTAGQERHFNVLPHQFFREFDAALVTFDVSSRKSYFGATIDRSEKRGEFKSWMREITDRLDDSRPAVIILVGTKSDIREREVTYAETTFYAEWKGIEYVETSSKEDINVDKVFFLACKRLVDKQPNPQDRKSDVVNINNQATTTGCACYKRR